MTRWACIWDIIGSLNFEKAKQYQCKFLWNCCVLCCRCEMDDILLEMDRILRPEGSVIIRDDVDVLIKVKSIINGMEWESQIVDHEDGPLEREKLLFVVKKYWTAPSASDNNQWSLFLNYHFFSLFLFSYFVLCCSILVLLLLLLAIFVLIIFLLLFCRRICEFNLTVQTLVVFHSANQGLQHWFRKAYESINVSISFLFLLYKKINHEN